jgi:myo-inositol-1(or 4)-monophosphatase
MVKDDLFEMEKFMKEIIVNAGTMILKNFRKSKVIDTKEDETDLVTDADIECNNYLTNAIKKRFPDHEILSEEATNQVDSKKTIWIIDPIDGTNNYAKGIPIFGVLIAIMKNNNIIMGAAYMPNTNELYFVSEGKGAYLNGKRIFCSKRKDFKYSMGTGYFSIKKNNSTEMRKLFESETTYEYWLNDFGAAIMNMTLVADGRRDWHIFPYVGGLYDIAAQALMMKEAGCKVTNIKGEDWTPQDLTMVAANPALHKEIMKIIRN